MEMKTTVNPIRIPKTLTFLDIMRIPRTKARMASLKRLKMTSFPVGLYVPVRP